MTQTPAAKTMAEQFCEMDSDLADTFADQVGGEQTFAEDDHCEVTFPDGSVASTEGGEWNPRALPRVAS